MELISPIERKDNYNLDAVWFACPKCGLRGEYEVFLSQKPVTISSQAEIEDVGQCPQCGALFEPSAQK